MPRSVAIRIAREIEREGQRRRVLRAIERRPVTGLTCDEVEQRLGMLHQTCSARISELKDSGDVYESGSTRLTRTGSAAMVLRPARQCGVGRPRK